jgi:hypothetical protein
MAAVCLFSSVRIQHEVGCILGVRWRKSAKEASRTIEGYVVKKWILRERERSLWTACMRGQLTLEEPARKLARSFFGPILLFPFAAGASVDVPPDVATAYGVRSIGVLQRHLGIRLTSMQCDELNALLFDGPYRATTMGHRQPEVPGAADRIYADHFIEALRRGHNMPAPDADLFSAFGGTYLMTSLSSSTETSPIRSGHSSILSAVAASAEPLIQGSAPCSICQENRPSICFIPCGHQTLCDECTRGLCHSASSSGAAIRCPLCRKEVESAIRPFV